VKSHQNALGAEISAPIPLGFGTCKAYLNGESAGTLEIPISCEPDRCVPVRVFHEYQDPAHYYSKPANAPPDRMKIAGGASSLLARVALVLLGSGLACEAFAFWSRDAQSQGWFIAGLFDRRERMYLSLRDFSHVRIVEMEVEGSGDDPGRPAWLVSLEGPVHYASNTGIVQRQRGVELAMLDTHLDALVYAARIGAHLGLRILDTGESWA
jgi:hypothetical protein